MDSEAFLCRYFYFTSCIYSATFLLPPIFLYPTPDVFGPLPYLFPITTSGNTKKATDGTCFLDSVVAPLDLGMRGIPCLRVKANEQSQPNRSTQAEAEWQTQNHYRSKDA